MTNKIAYLKSKSLTLFLATLVIVGYFFVNTMIPSVSFHDAGELQTVVPNLNIAHPTGFPTYILLGKLIISLIPFGEIAWKVTFLSTLYSLGVLLAIGLFIRKLTNDKFVYLVGILALAFCKPFWNYAGIADTHTLSRLFLALLLYLFLLFYLRQKNWLLFLFSFIFGLGLGNHLLLLYSLPGFGFWFISFLLKKKDYFSVKIFLYCLLFFSLGLAIYILLPLREFFGPLISINYSLQNWPNFIRHTTGADFQGLMYQGSTIDILTNAYKGLIYLKESMSLELVLVGMFGIFFGLKKFRVISISLLIMFISFLLFSTNYPTSDPTRYYLSFIVIYTLFICLGAIALFNFLKKLNLILALGLFVILLTIPLRSIFTNYSFVDKSSDFGAKNYSETIFQSVPKDSVILSWWNYSTPLWYQKYVLKKRPDIKIINIGQNEWLSYIRNNPNITSLYMVEDDSDVKLEYNVISNPPIYRVLQKK